VWDSSKVGIIWPTFELATTLTTRQCSADRISGPGILVVRSSGGCDNPTSTEEHTMKRKRNDNRGMVMHVYSEAELSSIMGIVNDPQFNSLCLRITTEPPRNYLSAVVEEQEVGPKGELDAELGRYPE
jgi:hypothetical protein